MPGKDNVFILIINQKCSAAILYNPVGSEKRLVSAFKTYDLGASLVAQLLRVCLPMQGTRVRALVWEDPTCRGTAMPVSHKY